MKIKVEEKVMGIVFLISCLTAVTALSMYLLNMDNTAANLAVVPVVAVVSYLLMKVIRAVLTQAAPKTKGEK